MEEKKEEKWMMPEDIKVIETNKPEANLREYLQFRKNYMHFFQ